MEIYLKETYYFDYTNEAIQNLIEEFLELPLNEQITGLFLKTRDNWRYNPYVIYVEPSKYKASSVASRKEGHCIDKSVLLIAGYRALGIPSRIRLAKVTNHIAVESLTKKLGNQYIAPHGILEVFINNEWYKVSNAFNKELCEKFNVEPLLFDGRQNAMLQEYNRNKEKYMEYIEDYGYFEDVPFDFIVNTFQKNYPQIVQEVDEDGKYIF